MIVSYPESDAAKCHNLCRAETFDRSAQVGTLWEPFTKCVPTEEILSKKFK